MKVNCKLPKTLAAWVNKHPDRIIAIDYGSGYTTESEMAYDILLNRGWCSGGVGLHTIIEQTASETLRVLRDMEKCECRDCITGDGW